MPELMMPAERAEEIDMRTFDLDKTYYLNSSLDDGMNEGLATLPLYAPIQVTEVRPDGDGEVWVRSKCDGTALGYVLASAILDDIPGAADLREAKAGDRVMILDAYAIESYVEQCPFGIVGDLQDQPGRLRFRFENDLDFTYFAEEWTLDIRDAEAEKTPEVPTFKKGDKVRVKEAVYYQAGKRIPQPNLETGAVCKVNRLPGDGELAEGNLNHGNLTVLPGYYLALDAIELVEEASQSLAGVDDEDAPRLRELEAELAEVRCALGGAKEQYSDALADLESFKRQVRENVIYQHQSKGWLDEHVNDLLESLELDPIAPAYDGPVHVGSIIKLNDGRVAVIGDTTSQPFLAFRPGQVVPLTEWLAVADVVRIGVDCEIHNNEHYAADYIKV